MKKVVLNISDSNYERFRLEALLEKKSVQDILTQRIFHKPFDKEIEEAHDKWLNDNLKVLINE